MTPGAGASIKSFLSAKGLESRLPAVEWSNRALFRLLWPLVVEQLLGLTIGLVDTMMVVSLGEYAVSGVSIVDVINVLVITAFGALATGGAVVSSQYIGRRDIAGANRAARQLVYIIVIVSACFTVIALVLRRPLLQLIYGNISADVMRAAETYFLITSLSYPFLALYNACAALFRSIGNSRITMMTVLLMNVFHIIGNTILIYGLHIGVAGAAISTLVSRIAAGIILLALLMKGRPRLITLRGIFHIRFEPAMIRSILNIGVPAGLESSMFQFGKILISRIFASFGTAAIAANAVANVLTGLAYMPGNAYGLALITIVGQCVGAGDYGGAKKYTAKVIKIAYVSFFLIGLLSIIFLDPMVGIFKLSDAAHGMAKTFIRVHSVGACIFWPMSFIIPNALKAAGDARYCMVVGSLTMWLVRVWAAYVLSYSLGFGPLGVWLGMVGDFFFRSIFFSWRWFRGRWQSQQVID
ncbi:MATE family multidrug exporter [Spirochaetia bacterium]|nr:MATE family multidrug exporter [Spirochaetia bacterium]